MKYLKEEILDVKNGFRTISRQCFRVPAELLLHAPDGKNLSVHC